jgi:hypothetical protein
LAGLNVGAEAPTPGATIYEVACGQIRILVHQ